MLESEGHLVVMNEEGVLGPQRRSAQDAMPLGARNGGAADLGWRRNEKGWEGLSRLGQAVAAAAKPGGECDKKRVRGRWRLIRLEASDGGWEKK